MKLKFALVIAAVMAAVNVSAQAPSERPPPHDPRYDVPQQNENTKIAYADVLRVDPVYDRVQANGAHEECEDIPVDRHVDGGNNNAAGTVIGAIVGTWCRTPPPRSAASSGTTCSTAIAATSTCRGSTTIRASACACASASRRPTERLLLRRNANPATFCAP